MSTYPYGGGYNCAVCGAFVPAGTTHSCGTAYRQPEVRWDRMSDVRIADALERIAAALERIAEAGSEAPVKPREERGY